MCKYFVFFINSLGNLDYFSAYTEDESETWVKYFTKIERPFHVGLDGKTLPQIHKELKLKTE